MIALACCSVSYACHASVGTASSDSSAPVATAQPREIYPLSSDSSAPVATARPREIYPLPGMPALNAAIISGLPRIVSIMLPL